MKRRGFLQLLGAAAATPFLPMGTAVQAASYNRYTYGLAVFHARTRAHVSARGIAHCLKVSVPQAEAMIGEMVNNGLVKPVFGGPNVRAVSNILKPDAWGLEAHARKQRAARRKAKLKAKAPQHDLTDMITHLRKICVDYGMTLHPRCTGGLA
jgi:hypothetical protein